MNSEIKNPRKPFAYYLMIVMLVLFLVNTWVLPFLAGQRVETVDYATFMNMTLQDEVGLVQIEYNQIIFTDRAQEKYYRTGVVEDPGLTERLHAHGAVFGSEIQEETSPLLTLFLSWVMPLILFGCMADDADDEQACRLHVLRDGEVQCEGVCQGLRRHQV